MNQYAKWKYTIRIVTHSPLIHYNQMSTNNNMRDNNERSFVWSIGWTHFVNKTLISYNGLFVNLLRCKRCQCKCALLIYEVTRELNRLLNGNCDWVMRLVALPSMIVNCSFEFLTLRMVTARAPTRSATSCRIGVRISIFLIWIRFFGSVLVNRFPLPSDRT